jgi:hypothetical protein
MNPEINPKKALENFNEYLFKIEELLKKNHGNTKDEKEKLNTQIQGMIRAVFKDDDKKIEDYRRNVDSFVILVGYEESEIEKQEKYISKLNKMKNHIQTYIDELNLIISSKPDLIKLNKKINEIINEVNTLTLDSQKINEFISFLENYSEFQNKLLNILIIESKEWLMVISFLLEKFEKNNTNLNCNDWKDKKIQFEKFKKIVDDMKYSGIFSNVIWGMGGYCLLQTLDKTEFLQFLYTKIIDILNKLLKQIPNIKSENIINLDTIEQTEDNIKFKPVQQNEKPNLYFSTNLKSISEELKVTINILNKLKSQEEIEKWISQFIDYKDRIYALRLLNNIRYYNIDDVINLYQLTHKNLLFNFDENPNIKNFLFVPAGNAGSSGSKCAQEYRNYNSLNETQIVNPSELSNFENNSYKYIIFVDDFIGSGNQANIFLKEKINFEDLKSKGIEKFYFVSLIGFDEGIKFIEKNNDIKVIVAEKLDEKDKVFSDKSTIFSAEEKEEARQIFEKYGKKLCKDFPLGYNNFGALISFYYKTPNHTLPIFWSDARKWIPIFKRYYH